MRSVHVRWRPDWRENVPAAVLSVWWLLFAAISFYWAAGGLWLVDSAVEAEGRRLARERPAWIVVLVAATGIVKLAVAVFGYLLVVPAGRRIPRGLYLLGGWAGGLAALGYGLLFSLPVRPYLTSGDMTAWRWMRLLVWMPQFWVGGLLLVLATAVFRRRTSPRVPVV